MSCKSATPSRMRQSAGALRHAAGRLRQRTVCLVAMGYAIGSWAVVQAGAGSLTSLGVPPRWLAALGLVTAAVLPALLLVELMFGLISRSPTGRQRRGRASRSRGDHLSLLVAALTLTLSSALGVLSALRLLTG